MKLLDTDICIHLLNSNEPELLARFAAHQPSELALCSIVLAELFWGARHSQQIDKNLNRIRRFAEPLPSLPFDNACAETYGQVRARLAAKGQPIGPNDTLIAAIALTHDAALITRNQREFGRIDELSMEVW